MQPIDARSNHPEPAILFVQSKIIIITAGARTWESITIVNGPTYIVG